MTYMYKGTKREEPTIITRQPRNGRKVALCGSPGGYDRHRNAGEEACPKCKARRAADSKAYRDRKRGGPPRELHPCGTIGAYDRHLRAGEYACDPCLDAVAKYEAERVGHNFTGRRRRAIAECGTKQGAMRHRNRGEPLCYPCKLAEAKEAADRYIPRAAQEKAAA